MDERPKVGIGIIVLKDGKVLCGKRKNAHGDGTWSVPGGHLEFQEPVEVGAAREVLEETGVKIKNIKVGPYTNDIFPKENKHYLTLWMIADYDSGEATITEPDKFEQVGWFAWEDLPQPLFIPAENLRKTGFDPIKLISKPIEKPKIGVGFGVMLLKDNKILLGKRHTDAQKAKSALNGAGTWTMPGGKLKFGETFEQGAIREVLEETGIKLKSAKVIALNNDQVEGAHFVTIGLHSEDFQGEAQTLEPEEITEWRWFSLDNLPSPLYFPTEKVLNNYKQKSFYI